MQPEGPAVRRHSSHALAASPRPLARTTRTRIEIDFPVWGKPIGSSHPPNLRSTSTSEHPYVHIYISKHTYIHCETSEEHNQHLVWYFCKCAHFWFVGCLLAAWPQRPRHGGGRPDEQFDVYIYIRTSIHAYMYMAKQTYIHCETSQEHNQHTRQPARQPANRPRNQQTNPNQPKNNQKINQKSTKMAPKSVLEAVLGASWAFLGALGHILPPRKPQEPKTHR